MWVFVCAGCGTPLSIPLREVPWRGDEELPGLPHLTWEAMPARMVSGTFAVNTYPPRAARPGGGTYAGPEGVHYVLHPGDTRDTVLIIDAADDLGCLGIAGSGGANIVCAGCRSEIGFRIDDCETWQQTLLSADAVDRHVGPAIRTPGVIRYPQVDPSLVDKARWRHGDRIQDFQRTEVAGPGHERWFGESAWRDEVERVHRDERLRLDETPPCPE